MKREFQCWFPEDGDDVSDAVHVLGVHDAEDAAANAVEQFRSGPDWNHLIDGDAVLVAVRAEDGDLSAFRVRVRSSIDYIAEQVDEAEARGA